MENRSKVGFDCRWLILRKLLYNLCLINVLHSYLGRRHRQTGLIRCAGHPAVWQGLRQRFSSLWLSPQISGDIRIPLLAVANAYGPLQRKTREQTNMSPAVRMSRRWESCHWTHKSQRLKLDVWHHPSCQTPWSLSAMRKWRITKHVVCKTTRQNVGPYSGKGLSV